MAIKQIHVCDGCGRKLEGKSRIYRLDLRTDSFWNGVEMDYLEKNLEFCGRCAIEIKATLNRILAKMEGRNYCDD